VYDGGRQASTDNFWLLSETEHFVKIVWSLRLQWRGEEWTPIEMTPIEMTVVYNGRATHCTRH
jgi:hypothetical protein